MGLWRSCDDWFTLRTLRLSFSTVKCTIDRTQIKTKRRCELALLLCINASHSKTIRQINKASLSFVVFLVTSPFFSLFPSLWILRSVMLMSLYQLRLTKLLLWILTSMLICICLCSRLSSKPFKWQQTCLILFQHPGLIENMSICIFKRVQNSIWFLLKVHSVCFILIQQT